MAACFLLLSAGAGAAEPVENNPGAHWPAMATPGPACQTSLAQVRRQLDALPTTSLLAARSGVYHAAANPGDDAEAAPPTCIRRRRRGASSTTA